MAENIQAIGDKDGRVMGDEHGAWIILKNYYYYYYYYIYIYIYYNVLRAHTVVCILCILYWIVLSRVVREYEY